MLATMHDLHNVVKEMIESLASGTLSDAEVIPWASPVPVFGNLDSSVATLGLNPSRREIVDGNGVQLRGNDRRLHTLESLDISSWSEANERHHRLIFDACRSYFSNNPYRTWFRPLDKVVSGADASYYNLSRSACHLDLVPFATKNSWRSLGRHQSRLIEASDDALGKILRESSVRVLILNGGGVVGKFKSAIDSTLTKAPVDAWTLEWGRKGYSYRGGIRTVCGIDLSLQVIVLGFTHNIQGTPGISDEHVCSIRDWIAWQLS